LVLSAGRQLVLHRRARDQYRRLTVTAEVKPQLSSSSTAPTIVTVGVGAFAVYQLALAAFMAIAPRAFFTDIGPFGTANAHYIRDVATYNAAIAFGFAVSVRRPSWRIPVLALTTVQFALHSVNHLVDIGKAHPAFDGYFDFFSLAVLTVLLAWLWRRAVIEDGATGRHRYFGGSERAER
jgi:hypothetical protein